MKNHTFGISLISILGVICAGVATDAFAASSVRALGGAGTYNGTSAAATSTRTAPTRAGSLRVSPSSARLITNNNSGTTTATTASGAGASGTTQRLSVGKYLGAATTSSGSSSSSGSQTSRLTELENRVSTIEDHMPASGDGIVLVDENNGEISINTAALLDAMNITSGNDGREVELDYVNEKLVWRYAGDTEWTELLDVAALTGDYLTTDDLADAIATIGGFQPKSTADYQVGGANGTWKQLTEAQIAALNSGANTTNIAQIATNTENIATLSDTLDELTDIEGIASGLVTNDDLTEALAGKQDTLTPAQLAAVNSGVTSTTVEQVAAHSNSIATLTSEVSGKADADSVYSKSDVNTLLSNKADLDDLPAAPVQSDWNETNESSLAYIANKPEIPAGVIVESSLSATSENAVQNKVIKSELDKKIPAGVIPLNNQYVLGYVNGVQMYIPIVDGEGNSGYPIIAATGEQVTE